MNGTEILDDELKIINFVHKLELKFSYFLQTVITVGWAFRKLMRFALWIVKIFLEKFWVILRWLRKNLLWYWKKLRLPLCQIYTLIFMLRIVIGWFWISLNWLKWIKRMKSIDLDDGIFGWFGLIGEFWLATCWKISHSRMIFTLVYLWSMKDWRFMKIVWLMRRVVVILLFFIACQKRFSILAHIFPFS